LVEAGSFDQRRDCVDYYGAKDLAESFRTVRKNTITIAQEVPEEKYGFRPVPGTRTVGELLAHISLAYKFQYKIHGQEHRSSLEGFDFPSMMQQMQGPDDRDAPQLGRAMGWLDGRTYGELPRRAGRDACGDAQVIKEPFRNDSVGQRT
jgi:hypothetical protein